MGLWRLLPLAVLLFSGGSALSEPLSEQAKALGSGSHKGLETVIPLSKLDPDSPVTIQSEALEVIESEDGARTLAFRKNVRVEQADLRLRAASLEATYPAGAKQPSRLVARGGVRITQGEREARCDRADYKRAAQKIFCRGNASIRDGEDRLEGDVIILDLASSRVTVEGGTEVALIPSSDGRSGGAGRLGDLGSEGPVRIHAQGLEATETSAGRRITFRGSVDVTQQDLSLAADEIEALYPPGADEPDTILAEGSVRIRQGERSAECVRAKYDRPGERLDCAGPARLAQRGDWVTGDRIEFDLKGEHLRVIGGTHLVLAPREPAPEGATP